MSTILQPLIDRLRAIPSAKWEDVASAAGVAKSLPRKIATGDRQNPGIRTIQPLIDYFAQVDAGSAALPAGCERAPTDHQQAA